MYKTVLYCCYTMDLMKIEFILITHACFVFNGAASRVAVTHISITLYMLGLDSSVSQRVVCQITGIPMDQIVFDMTGNELANNWNISQPRNSCVTVLCTILM